MSVTSWLIARYICVCMRCSFVCTIVCEMCSTQAAYLW